MPATRAPGTGQVLHRHAVGGRAVRRGRVGDRDRGRDVVARAGLDGPQRGERIAHSARARLDVGGQVLDHPAQVGGPLLGRRPVRDGGQHQPGHGSAPAASIHVGVRSTGHPEGREAIPPGSRIPMVPPGIPAATGRPDASRDIGHASASHATQAMRRHPKTPCSRHAAAWLPQLRSVMIHGMPQTIVTLGGIAPGHADRVAAIVKPLVTPSFPRAGPALTMTISSCARLSVALRLM